MNKIMRGKRTLFVVAFFSSIIFTPAVTQNDSTNYLSLDDVIYIAHQQSPDALIAKHRFRASYWEFRSFKADYLPGLTLDGTAPVYDRSISPVQQPDGSVEFRPLDQGGANARLSIGQRIGLTGGTISLNSRLNYYDNFTGSPLNNPFAAEIVNIEYVQPIFKYNPYKWDRHIEPMKYELAKRKYLEDVEQVSITATNYFFNLLQAQIDMQIAVKNMFNYDTLFRIAEGRYQLGKIAENDLLQLELNYLKAEAAVEQSELELENNLFRLKSYLRIKDDVRIELIPPIVDDFFTIRADKAIEEARYNSSTSLDFEQRRLQAQSAVNAAKMNGRFDADLTARFGLAQQGSTIPAAYTQPEDQQQMSLGFRLPILDWGSARGQIKLAQSQEELVFTSVEQEEIDFEQNIYLEVMQFNMQENQLRIAAKADTVAHKRFDVTQKRYMIGQVNDVLELNNAQIDTDNAKKGYYQAMRSYWRNYYQIRKETLYDFKEDRPILFNINETM
ncbi:MAG: TolC family protein [Bacteroidales bacterium]|nr:TolC family protein [Bacteroidales bacterium]